MSINITKTDKTERRFSRRTFLKSSIGLATSAVAAGGLLHSAEAQSQFSEYLPYDTTRDVHWGYSNRTGRREFIEHNHPGMDPTGEKFTFVRLKYAGGDWWTNLVNSFYWQSDLKFSQVLAENTSIDVNLRKHPQYVDINDEWLYSYPFLYMTGHGRRNQMQLTDTHIRKLREYFERGGFLLVEDCDIRYERFWPQVKAMMRRIYPDKKFEPLDLTHPVYHTLYNHDEYLGGDKLLRNYDYDQAIMDEDKIMVYFCPSDLNCAWEGRRCEPGGEEQRLWAFEQGMNIVAYALTR